MRHLSSAECATSRSGQRGVGSGSSRRRPFRPTATPSAERAACSATLDSSLVPASSAPAQRSTLPLKQRSSAHGVADLPSTRTVSCHGSPAPHSQRTMINVIGWALMTCLPLTIIISAEEHTQAGAQELQRGLGQVECSAALLSMASMPGCMSWAEH